MRKWGQKVRKIVKERVILRFNIPPLQNHCMSSCNLPKMWVLLPYCIFSYTSTSTSNFLLFLFFEVTAILGLLIRSLYLRLMTDLFKTLFFLFNFLFFLYHNPRCIMVLSWIALSNLFCSFKVSFSYLIHLSISLIHKYLVWAHKLEVLVDWKKVLGPLRHFSSPVILYNHIFVVALDLCLEIFCWGYLQTDK